LIPEKSDSNAAAVGAWATSQPLIQSANNLDCWRTSWRRKAFRCARGWIADCVCWTRSRHPYVRRIVFTGGGDFPSPRSEL